MTKRVWRKQKARVKAANTTLTRVTVRAYVLSGLLLPNYSIHTYEYHSRLLFSHIFIHTLISLDGDSHHHHPPPLSLASQLVIIILAHRVALYLSKVIRFARLLLIRQVVQRK